MSPAPAESRTEKARTTKGARLTRGRRSQRHHEVLLEALPVVEQTARRLRRQYANLVCDDDMRGAGNLALCDAQRRYLDGPGRSLATFARSRIFGAMMNEVRCAAHHARRTQELHVLDDVPWAGFPTPRDLVADAEESVNAVEALRAVLQDLADEDRLLLDLLFGDELDQHEVGEILGITHETVCRRLARLRTKLRRRLQDLGVTWAPPPMQIAGHHPVLRVPSRVRPAPGPH